ncbi:MAG: PH domain-containing protein [Desulfomonilaceae bacterium]
MSVSTVRDGIVPSVGNKFLKMMLLTGIPFGLFMGILWSFLYGSKSGVVMGIVAGVLFGALMGAFAGYQKKKFEMERPTFAGEDLVKEGGANYFRNIEAVGGWIYLTDQRLLFKSHSINVQRHELSIPLEKISEAKPCMTYGIIPNGVKIRTSDGNTEKFVVEDRKDWVKNILDAKERVAASS